MSNQNQNNESEPEHLEIFESPSDALQQITRGEIDMQISTAKRYPRSIDVFKKRALEMVTLDEETAEGCLYSRVVGTKNGRPEFAEGMSIRMAEIVAANYGNIRVQAMVISQSERQVVARGVAHDLESNYLASAEVIESTVKKTGEPMSERMRIVIAKAALSKASRDAIFKVVPRALCKSLELAAKKLAVGEGESFEKRRGKVLTWINKIGIEPKRVWNALGVGGENDLTSDHLITLQGLRTSIKDGDTSIDDAFPPLNLDKPKTPTLEFETKEEQSK